MGCLSIGTRSTSITGFVTLKGAIYLKLILENVDTIADCFLLYQLESGQIISEMVHRNTTANNALYILIYVSMIVNQLVFILCLKYFDNLYFIKELMSMVFFAFTGAPELFIEYFYLDRYVTRKTDWYLFVRSALQFLLSLLTIYSALRNIYDPRNKYSKPIYKVAAFVTVPIGAATACRVVGSTYQYAFGLIKRDCFTVNSGGVYQSPFNTGCLRGVDYALMVLTFLPAAIFSVFFALTILLVFILLQICIAIMEHILKSCLGTDDDDDDSYVEI